MQNQNKRNFPKSETNTTECLIIHGEHGTGLDGVREEIGYCDAPREEKNPWKHGHQSKVCIPSNQLCPCQSTQNLQNKEEGEREKKQVLRGQMDL